MIKTKTTYNTGSVFCVPLIKGGYAIGIIIRVNDSIALGHFLNKKFDHIPEIYKLSNLFLDKQNIAYIKKFGTLGLDKGAWPILGTLSKWDESQWQVPPFTKRDLITNQLYLVYYDDNLRFIRQEAISNLTIDNLPEDGTAGYGLIEKKLSNMLS